MDQINDGCREYSMVSNVRYARDKLLIYELAWRLCAKVIYACNGLGGGSHPVLDIRSSPLRSLARMMFGHCILQVLRGKTQDIHSMTTRNFVLDKGDQLLRVSLE